jgi:hypothetical protein
MLHGIIQCPQRAPYRHAVNRLGAPRKARADKSPMRILVANEPRAYREAIAGAVQVLRPHLAVIIVKLACFIHKPGR